MTMGDWSNCDRVPSSAGVTRHREVPGGRLYQVGVAFPSGIGGISVQWSAPVFAPSAVPILSPEVRELLGQLLDYFDGDNPHFENQIREVLK